MTGDVLDRVADLEIAWSRVLLYGLAVAVVGTIVVGGVTSTAAFAPFNFSWDGTSDFREQIEDEPSVERGLVQQSHEYDGLSANETVAIVVAPKASDIETDGDHVRRFVENGGTLVVFDADGAGGNVLLEEVGAESRFDGHQLRDDHRYDGGPMMPVATPAGDHSLTDGVEQVVLNRPTAIDSGGGDGVGTTEQTGNATILVETSEFARFEAPSDEAGSGQGTALRADRFGPHPIATIEAVDDGHVVAVGDPTLTTNAMGDRADNRVFRSNLYDDDVTTVVFDVSHGTDLPPIVSGSLAVRESPPLQALIGVLAVAVIGIVSNRRRRSTRRWSVDRWSAHEPVTDERIESASSKSRRRKQETNAKRNERSETIE
ncbi:DUF4350 domain-containing protein [Natrarchaeobius oligotrophus]|uniref:DUF4350 domain-containing protein n=1 Tax=Natrarchaeobius chitinivorans TaxID=1679083 RepID=A0A3N6MXT0_NATCH|nr:DUF4350 domain-containing protein [Natrarchaeobius chitinivorans]RQH01232.1 DUF4350 domain-containing protein [Natrarchaeobius chitinivorans]